MENISTYNFKGKRAIVRVDFNVPLDAEYVVTDNTRIRAAIPTLKKVLEGGGSLILMSHLGRPKKAEDKFSLRHILSEIEQQLGTPVLFVFTPRKRENPATWLKMQPMKKRRLPKQLSKRARKNSPPPWPPTPIATSTMPLAPPTGHTLPLR